MKGIDAGAAATAAEGAARKGLGLDEAAELVGWRVEGCGPAAAGYGVDLLVDGEAVGCYVEKGTRGEDVDGDGVLAEGEFHDEDGGWLCWIVGGGGGWEVKKKKGA